MAITDGERVRALESNAAWASKSSDNTLIGKQTLNRIGSGAQVTDVQQDINDLKADVASVENEIDTIQTDVSNLQSDVAVLQSMDTFVYVGSWDASLNSPSIADGDGGATYGAGATYRVSVAGAQNLGSGSISFNVNDKVVYNLSGVWEKWDVVDEPGQNKKVEYRSITNAEDLAKQLTLAENPYVVTEVSLDVIGGCAQFYGLDFTVSGNVLTWSGLGLDGILAENDNIRISYTY